MKSSSSEEYSAVVAVLIEARLSAGVTQEELARRLRKPQSFVSKYERKERRLDVAEFFWVASALEEDPISLFKKVFGRSTKKGVA